MRDIAFAGTIELRTWWIRARESRISLLDWRRQCHHGPPLRRIGPKDIDSTPVSPCYYSPGLPVFDCHRNAGTLIGFVRPLPRRVTIETLFFAGAHFAPSMDTLFPAGEIAANLAAVAKAL